MANTGINKTVRWIKPVLTLVLAKDWAINGADSNIVDIVTANAVYSTVVSSVTALLQKCFI